MSFQGVPSNQVQWLLNKVKKGEAVSMDDFAKDFKYLYEVDAEKAYVTLLTNTTIVSQATRTAILNSYEVWRRNEGPAFWASQKAVLTVTNTAGELVIESGHVAKTLARKGRISVVSSQTEEFINAHEEISDGELADDLLDEILYDSNPSQLPSPILSQPLTSSASSDNTLRKRKSDLDGSHEDKKIRRTQRYAAMDIENFWVLQSGRSVEEIFQEANLKEEATIKMRSFTIDFTCTLTKSLFREDEWNEIMEKDNFNLPDLPPETVSYMMKMRKPMITGTPVNKVPSPDDENFSCNLIRNTIDSWKRLYKKSPSPFSIDDLSESFWARRAWPLTVDLLEDVDNLFMIDGEKAGLESSIRKNSGRKYNTDGKTPRKRIGRKFDLIFRDVVEKRDWMAIERMKKWDQQSIKFLKETETVLFRETHTIMMHRLKDTFNDNLWEQGRFFGIYTGDRGFKTFELRPAVRRSYISLFHEYPTFDLPSSVGDMKAHIQGMTHLLQVRQCMIDTITIHRTPQPSIPEESDEEEEEDFSWIYRRDNTYYTDTNDDSVNLASSP